MERKKVIIVGGGFGGLKAAKVLGHVPEKLDVVLIDKKNHHLFQPLLYQVATAALSPADIATPIRSVLSHYSNITVVLGNVESVDPPNKKIKVGDKDYFFDFLILACGASHSYFGNDHWEEFAPGLKTVEMAVEIRRRILMAFESAEKEIDEKKLSEWLTFIVVGGGPTGVEMAGSIAEISRQTLKKDFRHIRPKNARIILVEAGEKVLASFDDSLSKNAKIDLEKLGVEVLLKTRVVDINAEGVKLKEAEKEIFIRAQTVIWAAGVKPSSLNRSLNSPMDKNGRLIVKKNLSLPQYSEIYCIGDQAHLDWKNSALPGLAPVAIQEGECAALNILRSLEEKKPMDFFYRDKGQMATIGRKLAVMEFKGVKAHGVLAWVAWLFVHIYYLIGFKNRLIVLFQWAWSYFTFARGARLITKRDWKES